MTDRPIVLVTQPYVPAYRHALFDAVHGLLAQEGIDFWVAAGHPSGAQAARRDEIAAKWMTGIRERSVPVAKWRLALRAVPHLPRPTVVVSELEALNLYAWARVHGQPKLVLWGHGRPYVNDANWISERLEWALARRADAVMTYTERGRAYLLDKAGIDPHAVTAIGNATDSQVLRAALEGLSIADRKSARREFGMGPNALFVGGLDESKRVSFMLEAARQAVKINPQFRLLIVGRGELEGEVRNAIADGYPVRHVPNARGPELARIASAASAIWMPGRVGLVAVDALALGLPVHTTDFRYHAPEIDFLPADFAARLTDQPEAFAAESIKRMAAGRLALPQSFPTIAEVSQNFFDVIIRVLR